MNPPPTALANARPPTWRRWVSSEQVLAAAPSARSHMKHCWWLEPEAWELQQQGPCLQLPLQTLSSAGLWTCSLLPTLGTVVRGFRKCSPGTQATELRHGFAGGSETAYGLMLHGFQRVLLSSYHIPSSSLPLDSGDLQLAFLLPLWLSLLHSSGWPLLPVRRGHLFLERKLFD